MQRLIMSYGIEQAIFQHINEDSRHECGGFLLAVCIDEQTAVAVEYFPCAGVGSGAEFTFSAQERDKVSLYRMRYAKEHGLRLQDVHVFTVHSHAAFDAFISGVDEHMMRLFPDYIMVVSPSTRRILCRRYTVDGKYEKVTVFRVLPERKPSPVEVYGARSPLPAVLYRSDGFIPGRAKKILWIGCGTLGSATLRDLLASGEPLDILLVDSDLFGIENAPRSAIVDAVGAAGKPKAEETARAAAKLCRGEYRFVGLRADAMLLGGGFMRYFDIVYCPADNSEVRQFASVNAKLAGAWFVNAGTSYKGVFGEPKFSGTVCVEPPSRGCACYDCEHLTFNRSAEKLLERTSCAGGAVPKEVQPQVMTSSSIVGHFAAERILDLLRGTYPADTSVWTFGELLGAGPVLRREKIAVTGSCAHSLLHTEGQIPELFLHLDEPEGAWYDKLSTCFSREEEGFVCIDMVASLLTGIAFRPRSFLTLYIVRGAPGPVRSKIMSEEIVGRGGTVTLGALHLGDYPLPRDHYYVVCTGDMQQHRYLRIHIEG